MSWIPEARVVIHTEPRRVTWSELWRVLAKSDLSIPITMFVAGVVCVVLATVPHEPRSPFDHEVSLEHMPSIAVMWLVFVVADVVRRLASSWWFLRRFPPMGPVTRRWSVGNLIGTALLAAFTTAQLTAI